MIEISNKTQKELLEVAKQSVDGFLLSELSFEVDSMVRRAVARNINTPSDVISYLMKDPVLNVSYMASLNPNCSNFREFPVDINHPCVHCEKDERMMQCTDCERLSSYKVLEI